MKHYKIIENYYFLAEDGNSYAEEVTIYSNEKFVYDELIYKIAKLNLEKSIYEKLTFNGSQKESVEEITKEEYDKAKTDPEKSIFKFDGDNLIDKEKCEQYLKDYLDEDKEFREMTKEETEELIKEFLSSIYDYFNIECLEDELIPFFAFDNVELKKGTERLLLVQRENETRKDIQKRIQKVLKENILNENVKYKINSISGKYNYELADNVDFALTYGYIDIKSNECFVTEIKNDEEIEKEISYYELGTYVKTLFNKLENGEIDISKYQTQIEGNILTEKIGNVKRIYIIELYY